jgi:energy-coupling factor transporter ATP-binding protein EcfA2
LIVSKLEIRGFRGVRHGEVQLSKFTTLVGPNNCGKTTIVEALALVLGRDRLVRSLTEHDFTGSDPKETDRISIVASITGFEPNDPTRHNEWFRWGRATVKWFDPESGTIKPNKDTDSDLLTCQIAFAARFDLESLEAVTIRYFYDGDIDPFADDANIESVPSEFIRKVGFFLIPASRTWDRTISFGSELFRRVVSYVGGRPAAAVLAERARLRSPPQPLEADDALRQLVSEINDDIALLLGQSIQLKLRLTTTDSEGILESVVPHFAEGDKIPLPSRRHGSGLISLQTLILLIRFGQIRVARGDGFMMVIEEPELHVPPPLQRKLLRMLQAMTTQTVVTTHSSTVASVAAPHEVQMVANAGGELSVRRLTARPLSVDAQNPIRNLLLLNRDETINALVPEGRLDAAWLRQLVKVIELGSDDPAEIGLSFSHEVGPVPTADARGREVYEHLRTIHPSVFCVFDGDKQGSIYTTGVCQSTPPPRAIIRWPAHWAIENIVGWVVDADPRILNAPNLIAMGVPQTSKELVASLQDGFKTDEIVHSAIADAFVNSSSCRRRIGCLLQFIADVAMGRTPAPGHGTSTIHGNRITTIWTFNHAIPGI